MHLWFKKLCYGEVPLIYSCGCEFLTIREGKAVNATSGQHAFATINTYNGVVTNYFDSVMDKIIGFDPTKNY